MVEEWRVILGGVVLEKKRVPEEMENISMRRREAPVPCGEEEMDRGR